MSDDRATPRTGHDPVPVLVTDPVPVPVRRDPGSERRRPSRWHRLNDRLVLMSGWTWVAAGSLIGIEGLELLLGAGIAMPEIIPLLVLGLAVCWFFRERLKATARRVRIRLRARRAFRPAAR